MLPELAGSSRRRARLGIDPRLSPFGAHGRVVKEIRFSRRLVMKIVILSINYWPEVTGIGAFTTYRAEYLASAGHDVVVCTTFPYYPEWKVPPAYSGKLFATETRNG